MRSEGASLLLVVMLGSSACSAPPVPPEVSLVNDQEEAVRRAGGPKLTPEEFGAYSAALSEARSHLRTQNARILPLRDYESVTESFRGVLRHGELLLRYIAARQHEEDQRFAAAAFNIEVRSDYLRRLSDGLQRQRLYGKDARRAVMFLGQARALYDGNPQEARAMLAEADTSIGIAEDRVERLLTRYQNPGQTEAWRDLVNETVKQSARERRIAIVVDKLGKTLTVYRSGIAAETYRIGVGRNSLANKLAAGDRATPEGRYHISGKTPASRYHKALLIDYPNEEDRRRFREARKQGLLPPHATIGGLIEIHGGGRDSLTDGCVALDNDDMDALYETIPVGTPVAIVGTTKTLGTGGAGSLTAETTP